MTPKGNIRLAHTFPALRNMELARHSWGRFRQHFTLAWLQLGSAHARTLIYPLLGLLASVVWGLYLRQPISVEGPDYRYRRKWNPPKPHFR